MNISHLDKFSVYLNANKKTAERGEVLVGLGNTNEVNKGLTLQHKTVAKHYASLSAYVLQLPIDNSIVYHTIYIEDYSVDTVVSIWIFLQKYHQYKLPEQIGLWIDYATRWESGDTTTTGVPYESYGCLQNALAATLKDILPKEILEKSFQFLHALMKNDASPAKILPIPQNALYQMAIETLQEEEKKYENLLKESTIQKFILPSCDSSERKEVSAIFIETDMISSIQKVFLRNDPKSPTGDGYAVMAVYNPHAAGTGNDIVISVDPLKKICLKELWHALEEEENRLWKGKRPMDKPRPLKSYPHNNGPNEPWWDDMGKYTLIASPKMIGDEYGRRVSWETVKQLIEQLYAKGAQV